MTDLTASSLRALKLMDLTTLNDDDTNEKVIALCHQAKTPVGNTAAICIYPRFIPIARKTLKEQGTPDIRIATVTNFPHGNDDIDIALAETRAAIAYGADEVDVVFPYRALIAGNEQVGFDLVKACKDACAAANVLLKVIIETGELKEEALIRKASEISIKAGADFIKTSTGKVPVNATPESARIMMEVIRDMGVSKTVGFKPAGGGVVIPGVSTYFETSAFKNCDVVFPGRVTDPHGGFRKITLQEIRPYLQRAGTAQRLNCRHALLLKNRMIGAKQQRRNGMAIGIETFHWQVQRRSVRLCINPGFRFGNGFKLRNDALFVVIQTDAEIHFVATRILFETLHKRKNRVASVGVNFLKHAVVLQVYRQGVKTQ